MLEKQGKAEAQIQKDITPPIKDDEEYRKAHMAEGAKIAIRLLSTAKILTKSEI